MALIQEEFKHDEWKMLIGCIMLNQTSNVHVRKVIYSFFSKWSRPQDIINADINEIREHIKPLGFSNRRSNTIVKFSHDYLTKPFKEPSELHGIGKYAQDSYEIFIRGNWDVEPTDKILIKYLNGEYIDQ